LPTRDGLGGGTVTFAFVVLGLDVLPQHARHELVHHSQQRRLLHVQHLQHRLEQLAQPRRTALDDGRDEGGDEGVEFGVGGVRALLLADLLVPDFEFGDEVFEEELGIAAVLRLDVVQDLVD